MAQIQQYNFQMRLACMSYLYIILVYNNNRKIETKLTYKINLTLRMCIKYIKAFIYTLA